MWEVQYAVRHDNVPGSLQDFGKIANRNFEIRGLTSPVCIKPLGVVHAFHGYVLVQTHRAAHWRTLALRGPQP